MSEPTPQPIDADDPGLTAYALGELEGPEAARYRAAIAASAELQAAVAEIQATCCLLTNELSREPLIPITAQASRSEPVAATQKRAFRFSRRVVAVAASVALIPGAWYAFQAAFPRSQRAPVLAQQEPQASSSGYFLGDDVQYFPVGPTVWRDTADKRTRPRVSSPDEADRQSVYDPANQEAGELFGARDVESALSEYKDKLKSIRGADPTVPRPRSESIQIGKPGQMVDGPGPGVLPLAKEAQTWEMRARKKYSARDYSANTPVPAEPQERISFGVGIGTPGERKPSAGLPNLMPSGSKSQGSQAGQILGPVDPVFSMQLPTRLHGDHTNAGGPRGQGRPSAGAMRGIVPIHNESQGAESGKLEAFEDAEATDRISVESDPYLGVPQKSVDKLRRMAKAPGEKGKPSAGGPGNNINSQFGDFLPPFGGGRKYAAPSGSKPPGEQGGPGGQDHPTAGNPKDTVILNGTSPASGLENKKLRISDGKPLGVAKGPEKGKPDAFDFTDESLDGVRGSKPVLDAFNLTQADPTSGEAYNPIYENAFITPQEQQLSTFSIDVDTASYANLRRFVQGGQLPPPDAVRIEELVNYFSYQYPQPQDGRPFSVQTDIAACPWQPGHQLVRIGLKGKEIPKEQRSPTNLVFLVDVSGSMQTENKLPLVRESLTTLVNQLDERDKVAIVTYAGEAGVRLPSTSVAQKEVVLSAIASLGAGGSTNGAAGINSAYDIAAQEFLEKGTNRVILCTDGDFNVGVTSDDALVKLIQTRAKGGVFLSVFGFGMGNLKDAKLEQLADKGNGQYGYIDDRQEANKVFVQELMGTLVTIAKDVKIQIDFNKDTVASYRLVGYENRIMAAEDFHDDKKDAGEIGAGHTVTALYQIVPIKDLKANDETRWLTVKLRYKQPDAATSVLMENPLVGQPGQLKLASSDFQFAASVAACGMLLRHSQHAGQANWGLVKELAQSGLSYDPHGHRRAFIGLAAQAESLMGQFYPTPVPATDSTVGGKYKSLLRRLHAPTDAEKYGQFNDFGHSDRKAYAGAENLPEGYWVYAAPYWYIWAEMTAK